MVQLLVCQANRERMWFILVFQQRLPPLGLDSSMFDGTSQGRSVVVVHASREPNKILLNSVL